MHHYTLTSTYTQNTLIAIQKHILNQNTIGSHNNPSINQFKSTPIHQNINSPIHQYTNTKISQNTFHPISRHTHNPHFFLLSIHQYTKSPTTSIHQDTCTPIFQDTLILIPKHIRTPLWVQLSIHQYPNSPMHQCINTQTHCTHNQNIISSSIRKSIHQFINSSVHQHTHSSTINQSTFLNIIHCPECSFNHTFTSDFPLNCWEIIQVIFPGKFQ